MAMKCAWLFDPSVSIPLILSSWTSTDELIDSYGVQPASASLSPKRSNSTYA